MKIAIRADASVEIGTGHIMRCLALADALRKRGSSPSFIARVIPDALSDIVRDRGYSLIRLPASAGTSREDAEATAAALSGEGGLDWLLVDHHGLAAAWETEMRRSAKRIMVIDDFAGRDHDCDLFLNMDLLESERERCLTHLPEGCEMLLGPKHALLREEFAGPAILRDRDGVVKRILVFFSGSDPTNECSIAVDALRLLNKARIHVDLILGAANPYSATVRAQATGLRNVAVHQSVGDLARLMSGCDLALGACGVNALERCAVGLPAIVVIVAENQRNSARALEQSGAIQCLGESRDVTAANMADALAAALKDPVRLASMSLAARGIVEGWDTELEKLADRLSSSCDLDADPRNR
jgi:UDP-2,4-diacetamido-2,4,6-trideoxy-beta-L-altropyranose hydrolase